MAGLKKKKKKWRETVEHAQSQSRCFIFTLVSQAGSCTVAGTRLQVQMISFGQIQAV